MEHNEKKSRALKTMTTAARLLHEGINARRGRRRVSLERDVRLAQLQEVSDRGAEGAAQIGVALAQRDDAPAANRAAERAVRAAPNNPRRKRGAVSLKALVLERGDLLLGRARGAAVREPPLVEAHREIDVGEPARGKGKNMAAVALEHLVDLLTLRRFDTNLPPPASESDV